MTYDDLLTRLRRRARRRRRRTAAAARLRARYGVVLVDEFQDTDPGAVGHHAARVRRRSDATLVLIGDPKQAIYAFRGADVYAYLRGRRRPPRHARRSTSTGAATRG